jgi:hypothetical protein
MSALSLGLTRLVRGCERHRFAGVLWLMSHRRRVLSMAQASLR